MSFTLLRITLEHSRYPKMFTIGYNVVTIKKRKKTFEAFQSALLMRVKHDVFVSSVTDIQIDSKKHLAFEER